MKFAKILLLVGMAFLMPIGCGTGNSPTKVVRQAYAVIEKGDAKAFIKLSDNPDVVSPADAAFVVALFKEVLAEAGGSIVSTEETIDGERAKVVATHKDGKKSNWWLVKVDGNWKVRDIG
jgi:hypothetical protein